jgi:hypothetical protein
MLALAIVLAALLLALPANAAAAPPPNDLFAAAEPLDGASATATGMNEDATKEPGEPNHGGNPGGHSIWYRWIAPEDGIVTIKTAGSGFTPMAGVYTGLTVDGLTWVTWSSYGEAMRFSAQEGVTYMIAVDGWYDTTGSVSLQLKLGHPPPNDAFDTPEVLSGEQASASGDTSNATMEPGEPSHANRYGQRSIWYSWTAPYTGGATVDTAGSDFNTVLGIYTGDGVSSLAPVGSNDDGPAGSLTSRVAFHAIEGTTYRIAVDGSWNTYSGNVALKLQLRPPPVNDLFANAEVLPGEPTASTTGRNDGATAEPGEPSHAIGYLPSDSVWYSWRAPRSGSLTIRADSKVAMSPAAYTGDRVSELSPVANQAQDYWGGDQIRIRVKEGTTYRIAIDGGYYGGGGDFSLSLKLIGSPANDDFADAVPLAGLDAEVDGTNVGATQEPGEPIHEANYYDPSVWYSWTAPKSGGVTLDTAGSALPTLLGVYTGDDVAHLSRVNSSRSIDSGTKRYFRAAAGVTYWIAVDGARAKQDTFHLKLHWGEPPANDMFADAQELTWGHNSAAGDTIGSTGEPGEPGAGAEATSVWYEWKAPSSGVGEVWMPRADFRAVVTIYTGENVGSLSRVAEGSDYDEITFDAVEGTVYRIAVGGGTWQPQRGEFSVAVNVHASPPNDDFADAHELQGESDSATGTNAWASREPGEPGPYRTGRSVWYSWTAPKSGRTTFATHGSSVYTQLDVYAGSSLDALTTVYTTGGGPLSAVFDAVEGTTYRIRVDSYDSNTGGPLKVRLVQVPPPDNDDFANATELAGSADSSAGSSDNASRQPGEPYHWDYGETSVWYRWEAPADGTATVDTAGSDYDTMLAAYTGSSVDTLSLVARNDNYDTSRQSRISFDAKAGTVYHFAVDGISWSFGKVALNLSLPPAEGARTTTSGSGGSEPPGDPPAGPPTAEPEAGPSAAPPSNPAPGPASGPGPVPGRSPTANRPANPPARSPAAVQPAKQATLSFSLARQKLGSVLKRGLVGTVTCSGPCSFDAHVQLGSASAARYGLYRAAASAPARFTIRLSKATKRKLARARSAKLRVTVGARIGDRTVRVTRRVTLRQ